MRRNRNIIEWEVDSLRQLAPGVLRRFAVRACVVGGTQCTTVARYLKLDDTGKPFVSFQGMPLEALGRQAAAPLGGGLLASGPEIETGVSVPGYRSMGQARSAGVAYSTRQSHPRALVNADVELTWPVGTPDQIKAVLLDGAARMDSVVVQNPTCAAAVGRRCRIALQADFAGTSFTRATRKWLRVEVTVTSGGAVRATTDSVEVALVDRRASPYGAGWYASGVTRLDSAGSDMMLVGPTGAVVVFRGAYGTYLPPPGDHSTLAWTGSQWELRPRGGGPNAKAVFDGAGRLTSVVDRNANATRITYVGSSEQVDSILTPGLGWFRYSYASGKLAAIADHAGRQNAVTIDGSNRLTYDSTASPASRPWAERYSYTGSGANGAVVLAGRVGPMADTTTVAYSARYRPTQVSLQRVLTESGSSLSVPVIGYAPQETRALGTLISADSVYARVVDPRGHWTHSALNRWGAAVRAWDAVGVTSRASYTPEGLVAWAEGPVADSTRVYYSYDLLGRLVRSFRRRAASDTVRLDSLVHDSLHRVIRRIGPAGSSQMTQYAYDSRGNVTQVTDPQGRSSTTWYNATNGLVDSTRGPGDTVATRYDYSYGNVIRVRDGDQVTLMETEQDALGRPTLTVRGGARRVTPDTVYYQWSLSLTAYAVDNLPDSTRFERSREWACVAECTFDDWGSATWPAGLADSLYYSRTAHQRNRRGQDTLVTDAYGRAALSVYDALGQPLVVRPFLDSAGIRDSLRYDIAGNVRFRWTRRAVQIEHRYDSRGRDTLTIVPGVGNFRRTFGGPNGELTALTVASYVDSIGGVNPSLAWVYGQAGQLLSDTAQGNRATAYLHDRLLRDSIMTDIVGAHALRYHSGLGYHDSVVTPFNDTLTHDLTLPKHLVTAAMATPAGDWERYHDLSQGNRTTKLRTRFVGADILATQGVGYLDGTAVGHRWAELQAGDSTDTVVRDSLDLDGWDRVTRARYFTGDSLDLALMAADTFSFDGRGNIRAGATGRSYHALTNRLRVVGSDTLTYDRAGNLVTRKVAGGSTWTYTYDALERLTAVRYGATLIARYGYDALGRRIARRVYNAGPRNATPEYVRLVYRGGQAVAEADSAGSLRLAYVWGWAVDDLVAVHQYGDGVHLLVVQDGLHSVRGLMVKSTGAWLASWRYRAYGQPLDSAGSSPVALRYRWAGQRYDPETGFYHMRARYYDPGTPRFTQDDPSHPVGDYGYADGNPTDGRDPSGLTKDWIMSMPDPSDPRLRECWGTFDGCGGGGGGGTIGGGHFMFDMDGNGIDDALDSQRRDADVFVARLVRYLEAQADGCAQRNSCLALPFRAQFERAMALTITTGHEHGFWITGNGHGAFSTTGIVEGDYLHVDLGNPPAGYVAAVHSHPDVGNGRTGLPYPSGDDNTRQDRWRYIEVILSSAGIGVYLPAGWSFKIEWPL